MSNINLKKIISSDNYLMQSVFLVYRCTPIVFLRIFIHLVILLLIRAV